MADTPRRRGTIGRRTLLGLAGGAAIAAVPARALAPSSAAAAIAAPPVDDSAPPVEMRRFVSTMLTTPAVTTWKKKGTKATPGLLFASPRTDGFNGIIMRGDGEPVWIEPDGLSVTDVRVQEYAGSPVLTYWSGKDVDGHGLGACVIKDTSYRTIATVRPGNGLVADLHEFTLTRRGTALLVAYPVVPYDLSPIGGRADGYVYGCRIQEVAIATGDVLLDWDALEHIDLAETYQGIDGTRGGATPEAPFDPIHLNAVDPRDDTLLISARHTHALYAIDRTSGTIRWRLGGRRSDYDVEERARFAWQHDARWREHERISLFDNNGKTGGHGNTSSGLILDVDHEARTVRLHRRFTYERHFGGAMGNLQMLDNGHVLVGWGSDPAATEFTADGTAIWEASQIGATSYRVYRSRWKAHPDTLPQVGVRQLKDGTMRVYASWNGATEVARWRILAGPHPKSLDRAGQMRSTGFESSKVVGAAHVVAVQAVDASDKVLATSAARALPQKRGS